MNNKNWTLVFLLGFLWGASFLFVEILLNYISPFMIVYLRVSLASLILILYLILSKIKFQFSFLLVFNFFIMGMLNNVFPFLLITYGQQTVSGGLASILNANTSFLTILLASLILKNEPLTKSRIIGVLIGVIGVIIVVGYGNIYDLFDKGSGKFLILLSGLSYAFAAIFAKVRLQNTQPEVAATGMLTMSTLILSPFIFLFYGNEVSSLNIISMSYSLLFAVICSVLAYFIYFKILLSTGAGNLLICTIIIPPSAILLNAILIGESITLNELIGLVIITFGLLILDGRLKKFI
ncbi:DMT family transporter [Pseudomonadota bacterium]|nr:DMT family transporter [Alphaproteobacteria bacterium]MDC1357125.1 DMT family transporter [Pseudomonadota bacterium]